jgi:ElaB/YqjD/DUF883 family membrane-anchored ribosome-binding protein
MNLSQKQAAADPIKTVSKDIDNLGDDLEGLLMHTEMVIDENQSTGNEVVEAAVNQLRVVFRHLETAYNQLSSIRNMYKPQG